MPVCTILNRQGAEVRRFATESPVIGSSLSVGRSSSCTIVLKHDAGRTVSRVHFVLEQRPVGWMLINKSSHGTYKGDRSIDQTPVSPGDVFQFGSCFFCFGEDARPSRYQLHWDDGGGGDEYAVLWPGRNTIGGASNNTIAVKQESVSRQHARITVNGDDVYLEDLNSSLGTFVGGKRVTALTGWRSADPLRQGSCMVGGRGCRSPRYGDHGDAVVLGSDGRQSVAQDRHCDRDRDCPAGTGLEAVLLGRCRSVLATLATDRVRGLAGEARRDQFICAHGTEADPSHGSPGGVTVERRKACGL